MSDLFQLHVKRVILLLRMRSLREELDVSPTQRLGRCWCESRGSTSLGAGV